MLTLESVSKRFSSGTYGVGDLSFAPAEGMA